MPSAKDQDGDVLGVRMLCLMCAWRTDVVLDVCVWRFVRLVAFVVLMLKRGISAPLMQILHTLPAISSSKNCEKPRPCRKLAGHTKTRIAAKFCKQEHMTLTSKAIITRILRRCES